MGFIVPNKFLVTKYGTVLRKFIMENAKLANYRDFSSEIVFAGARVYPVIIVLRKTKRKIIKGDRKYNLLETSGFDKGDKIVDKIEKTPSWVKLKVWRPLATTSDIKQGSSTIITNREVHRYSPNPSRKGGLRNTREEDSSPNKIILKKLTYKLEAILDDKGYMTVNTTYCIQPTESDIDIRYILGVLNSKLLTYYARKKYSKTALRGGYIELRVYQVKTLPIISIPLKKQQPLVSSIIKMIKLQKESTSTAKYSDRWSLLEDRIRKLDRKIDQIVFELYGLTPEEIKIVEKS